MSIRDQCTCKTRGQRGHWWERPTVHSHPWRNAWPRTQHLPRVWCDGQAIGIHLLPTCCFHLHFKCRLIFFHKLSGNLYFLVIAHLCPLLIFLLIVHLFICQSSSHSKNINTSIASYAAYVFIVLSVAFKFCFIDVFSSLSSPSNILSLWSSNYV